MGVRIFNFAPGPAVLPEEVLRQAQEALWNLDGSGIGVLEHSHRGPAVDEVFARTEAACRELAGIPEQYRLLFLQGGASSQFFMLPANLLATDRTSDYLHTGSWSKKAIGEARRYGAVHVAASSEDRDFTYVPKGSDVAYSEDPVYVHFTSNNTIVGSQYRVEPEPPERAWLACDASSDLFSRPIDVTRYGVIYAGAQKNMGPAGVTLLVIREDLLEPVRDLPTMLRYETHAGQDSRYNTPPVFGIDVMGRVYRWLLDAGGLEATARRNEVKAKILYDVIDASAFFTGTVAPDDRSLMNVVFRTPSEELDRSFVAEAEKEGLSGLKGHRSVGGMRASIYNAFPKEGCEALAQLMKHFEERNG